MTILLDLDLGPAQSYQAYQPGALDPALVANAGEALVLGKSSGMLFCLGFGSVCLGIAAYGFWCCWLRVRRQTLPQSHGFPVGQAAAP